jgi:hypothetical protein
LIVGRSPLKEQFLETEASEDREFGEAISPLTLGRRVTTKDRPACRGKRTTAIILFLVTCVQNPTASALETLVQIQWISIHFSK